MSDNTPIQAPPLPTTPSLAMLRTLGSIATISGLLVALTFKLTMPIIEENQRRATEHAISNVLPNPVTRVDFVITADGTMHRTAPGLTGDTVYATYNKDGTLQGLALLGVGRGYADIIKVLYAYRPDCECITGTKILRMTETPGFGDRMNYDPDFLSNFHALDAKLNAAGDGLANRIIAVKHGTKTKPWQIDALAGATVSSRGMASALEKSAERLLPQLRRLLPQLRAAGKEARASQSTTAAQQ